MNLPHEHVAGVAGGSPLYQISPEHLAAVFAVGVLAIGAWLLRRRISPLAPIDRLLVALLAGSAAVHAGLAIGHEGAIGLLFVADAVLLGLISRRVLRGSQAGRLGAVVLVGSIGAYWVSAIGGQSPDQVGLATKLGEILALAIVLRPAPGRRVRMVRSVAGSFAIGLLVIGTGATSWIGAFRASAAEPGAVAGHHVHGGSVPPPGTVIPAHADREPTPAERAAADALLLTTRTALARYADVAVAAADGYRVSGLGGIDFHAPNPGNENDGRVFDPARPEMLVYAVAPSGRPVLLGAVFQMPKIGQPGPTIGGPLTMWHGHEQVCISLTPPALAGLLSPLGTCPVGTILIPRTAEMIHVWIVPGAPQPFGDLDDAWKRAYLSTTVTQR
jgi:hypothetical protein